MSGQSCIKNKILNIWRWKEYLCFLLKTQIFTKQILTLKVTCYRQLGGTERLVIDMQV
jgi:hypothetical protein